MEDTFFTQTHCDRCHRELNSRTMSWFNNETICMSCKTKENEIRDQLPDNGRSYEGCGYIPEIKRSK